MKQDKLFTLERTRQLTDDVYEMLLSGDMSDSTAPGQFVDLELPGRFLRRPISICNWTKDALLLLVRVAGDGTREMVRSVPGTEFRTLSGLGNGFDVSKCGDKTLVIGGGVGVPPMYGLAKALLKAGKTPVAILGFNKSEELFYEEKFKALGIETIVTTVDGSYGVKGFVTDALPEQYDFFCTCGPEPMLKAIYNATKTSGLCSFEERMGCGFGACMGCSCKTKYGNKRICKDGPVLEKEEIIW